MSDDLEMVPEEYQNKLLNGLCQTSIASIKPYLSKVVLVKTRTLYKDDQPIEAVYFLESGLVTLIADTGDDAQVQVGMVGREGFAGTVSMFDGDLRSTHRAMVQIAGSALCMPQAQFQQAVEDLPDLKTLCMRHLKATILQGVQVAACNARHSILQRLCRLLLMMQERVGGTQMALTQVELSEMLGVHRAGISVAISSLTNAQILSQSRGNLEIVDREKLIYNACRCYSVIRSRSLQTIKTEI